MSEMVRTFSDIEKFLKYESNGYKFDVTEYIEFNRYVWRKEYETNKPVKDYFVHQELSIDNQDLTLDFEFGIYSRWDAKEFKNNIKKISFTRTLERAKVFNHQVPNYRDLLPIDIDLDYMNNWFNKLTDEYVKGMYLDYIKNNLFGGN